MNTTDRHALPYPEPADAITDYPAVGQSLAEAIDGKLARALLRETTLKDVANTIAETDLFNGELVIPAGELTAGRVIRVVAGGDFLNATGATRNTIDKVKLGATVLFQQGWNIVTYGFRRAWRAELELVCLSEGATGTVFLSGENEIVTTLNATVGLGDLAQGQHYGGVITSNGPVTVDTTIAQTLALTVTHPIADANLSRRLFYAHAEVVS